MSINWHADADPVPALLVLPPAAASLDEAHAAIELWEHYSGKVLDDTQRLTVEVMMAETAGGRWAAATTGREMPRQNGKGDEIEVVELWGLVQRAEAILHTVHDAVLLASQAQQRLLAVLDHKDLRPKVKRKWMGTGQQMIEFRNGGIIWYRTRTGAGGRGVDDIARLVVDEAQHATSEQMAAVTPTLLANENPQLNAVGTAGLAGKSEWWWRVRKRALSAEPGAFGYVGHTAERVHLAEDGRVVQEPVDVEDRSLWPEANPSVRAGRGGGMAFLEEQLQILGPEKFAEEHLCVWDPEPDAQLGAFPADDWSTCRNPDAQRGKPTYAVEVDQDGFAASIGASDGRVGVVLEWQKGSKWLPAKLAEILVETPGRVVLDPKGPAGALLHDLEALGIEWDEITPQEHARACGELFLAVTEDHSFEHTGQQVLDIAVKQATRRIYGNAWAWDRRRPGFSVSPLVVVTIARWAALQAAETPPGPVAMVIGGRK